MKLKSATITIGRTLRMDEIRPSPRGTVVAGANGRGKTAATAALVDLQAMVAGLGRATGYHLDDLSIDLKAASAASGDVLEYRIRIAAERPPRIAAETLRVGTTDPVELITMANGRGTWRPRPHSRPEPAELARADRCALSVAGAFSSHVEAKRLKGWIESWKLDRWMGERLPVSEPRAGRPWLHASGRGAMAAVGWMQEADSDLFEQLRRNVEQTTGKRLTDLRAVRSPDDQVTLQATVNGRPNVFWQQMPYGFRNAVRMEVRLLTAAPDDLIWSDCPDAGMDNDLSTATAARVCLLEADGPQMVMLTRNRDAIERLGGPHRRVLVQKKTASPQEQHFTWIYPIA